MNLVDLYKRQDQDLKDFAALRDRKWADMKERHKAYGEAFGGSDNLPPEQKKILEQEVQQFNKEWSAEHGSRYKEMIKQHQQQYKTITQETKTQNHMATKKPENGKNPEIKKLEKTRDQKKQEMIKAQKAIVKKTQEQKRKR